MTSWSELSDYPVDIATRQGTGQVYARRGSPRHLCVPATVPPKARESHQLEGESNTKDAT